MAYPDTQLDVTPILGAAGAVPVSALTTAAGVVARQIIGYKNLRVKALWATVIVSPTVTNAIATFKYRPTPGSASGEVVIGTLTLPVAAVIGKQYYKKLFDFIALSGGEVVVDITTTSTAGSAAFGFFGEPQWSNPLDNANMIASA
jgi:hypothetical protein